MCIRDSLLDLEPYARCSLRSLSYPLHEAGTYRPARSFAGRRPRMFEDGKICPGLSGELLMNYANIKYFDIADGEGVRTSLFVSGCRRAVSYTHLRVRAYRESAVRSWASLIALPSRRWTMTSRWSPLSFYGVDRRSRRLTGEICAVADTCASSELFWGTMVV